MNTSADTWVLFHRSLEGDGWAEFVSQNYADDGSNGDGFGRLIVPFGDYRIGFEVNNGAVGSSVFNYSSNGAPYLSGPTIGGFISGQVIGDYNGFWAGQMISVKGAAAAGAGAASVGFGIFSDSFEDNDDEENEEATGFNLNGSWGNGAPGAAGTIEIAAEFTTHKYKEEGFATNDELDGNHYSVNARYSVSDDSHLEGSFTKLSSDESDDDDTTANVEHGITAMKLGYVRDLVEAEDHGSVVELYFAYSQTTEEEDDAAEASQSNTMFPGWRFSSWHQVKDNWKIFVGVGSTYTWALSEEDPDGTNTSWDTDSERQGDDSFSWTAGLGFDPNDHIGLEFFLATENLDKAISLGNDTALIGGIGAHGSF